MTLPVMAVKFASGIAPAPAGTLVKLVNAAPLTFPAVEMVASFESSIPAPAAI